MSLSTTLELCLGQESATTQWESKVRNFNSFAVHESGVFNCSTMTYAVDIPPTRTFNASMYPILSSLLGQSLNKATGTPKLDEELAGHVRQNEPGHQLQATSLHDSEIQQLSDLKSVDLSSSDPSLSDHEPQLPQTNLPIGMRGFCAMYATIEEPPSDDLTGDDCYGHFDFSSDPDPERPPKLRDRCDDFNSGSDDVNFNIFSTKPCHRPMFPSPGQHLRYRYRLVRCYRHHRRGRRRSRYVSRNYRSRLENCYDLLCSCLYFCTRRLVHPADALSFDEADYDVKFAEAERQQLRLIRHDISHGHRYVRLRMLFLTFPPSVGGEVR